MATIKQNLMAENVKQKFIGMNNQLKSTVNSVNSQLSDINSIITTDSSKQDLIAGLDGLGLDIAPLNIDRQKYQDIIDFISQNLPDYNY